MSASGTIYLTISALIYTIITTILFQRKKKINKLENKIFTKITYPERKEQPMYDYNAVREVIINALVHNDWTTEYPPKFELFSDRLEVSSFGGIQSEFTRKIYRIHESTVR